MSIRITNLLKSVLSLTRYIKSRKLLYIYVIVSLVSASIMTSCRRDVASNFDDSAAHAKLKNTINFSNEDSFQISESGCIGCPAYSMQLSGNGDFQFQERFPKKWQVEHAQLPSKQLQMFLQVINSSNFEALSKLEMNCKQAGSEQSTITMILTTSGKSYKIIHDTGCKGFDGENFLLTLEQELKSALDIDHLTSDDKTINATQKK